MINSDGSGIKESESKINNKRKTAISLILISKDCLVSNEIFALYTVSRLIFLFLETIFVPDDIDSCLFLE